MTEPFDERAKAAAPAALKVTENPITSPNAHLVLANRDGSEHIQLAPIITETRPGRPTVYGKQLKSCEKHVDYDNKAPITFKFSPNKIIHDGPAAGPALTKKYTIRQIAIIHAGATQKYPYTVNAFAIDPKNPAQKIPLHPSPCHYPASSDIPCAAVICFGDPRQIVNCNLLPDDDDTVFAASATLPDDGSVMVGTDLKNFINIDPSAIDAGVQRYWDRRPIPGLVWHTPASKDDVDLTNYAELPYFSPSGVGIYSPNPVAWLITRNVKWIVRTMQGNTNIPLIVETQNTNAGGGPVFAITVHRDVYNLFRRIVAEKIDAANRTLDGEILIECKPDFASGRITHPAISKFATEDVLAAHVQEDYKVDGEPAHRPDLNVQITVCEYTITYADAAQQQQEQQDLPMRTSRI